MQYIKKYLLILPTIFSNQKYIKIPIKLKNKCLDDDEYKNIEITSNKNGKNIKATLNVEAHHNKCCKSRLNSM